MTHEEIADQAVTSFIGKTHSSHVESVEHLRSVVLSALKQATAEDKKEIERLEKLRSKIWHWIDRNHQDGFVDSQGYAEQLDKIRDGMFDRLDGADKEIENLKKQIAALHDAISAKVDKEFNARKEASK